jgi:uncharacterized protein (DUF983 family)
MTVAEKALPQQSLLGLAWACKCPRCGAGKIYAAKFPNLHLQKQCSICGLILADNDNADGPAQLLVWVLGIVLVPVAFLIDQLFSPPLWAMGLIFGTAALGLTLGLLRVSKAFFLNLQYRYRHDSWKQEKET